MHEAEIGWIAAIIVGGLAGWLAEMFMRSGTGILMNIILGIIGAAQSFRRPPHGLGGLFDRRIYRGLHHNCSMADDQRKDRLVQQVIWIFLRCPTNLARAGWRCAHA
jgi:hypothetical protein